MTAIGSCLEKITNDGRPAAFRDALAVNPEWDCSRLALVFAQQVVGEQLDVADGVLQFVPLALSAWTEVPESAGPAAQLAQLTQVMSEVIRTGRPLAAVEVAPVAARVGPTTGPWLILTAVSALTRSAPTVRAQVAQPRGDLPGRPDGLGGSPR
jgi:hypothetical protein